MIFGFIEIDGAALQTHRDTYTLAQISVISVRRPFLGGALLLAGGLGGFALAFIDLLHAGEIAALAATAAGLAFAGVWLGQLKLLSRDLRGSDLADAVWGSYAHLNRTRRDIARAMRAAADARSTVEGRP